MVDPVPQLESLPVERGTRVLVRADFNVPLRDGVIDDDLRITAALPTIEYLRERGAKVVCCSHLGRPKGKVDPQYSLAPVAQRLGELLGATVELSPQVAGFESLGMSQGIEPGAVMMIENLRFDPGEEANNPSFATNLSQLGDAYVDDAFGAAHRAHASIVGPPRVLPAAAGRLLAFIRLARGRARRGETSACGRLVLDDGEQFFRVLAARAARTPSGLLVLLARADVPFGVFLAAGAFLAYVAGRAVLGTLLGSPPLPSRLLP